MAWSDRVWYGMVKHGMAWYGSTVHTLGAGWVEVEVARRRGACRPSHEGVSITLENNDDGGGTESVKRRGVGEGCSHFVVFAVAVPP